jgi:D-tyrosyl-tRNA(Tyr) deacylase
MIGVIQRVSEAEVVVDGESIAGINEGLLLLLGIARDDGPEDISYLVNKTVHLRIFSDNKGNLNRSVLDERGGILVVSQFTLLADTRKGRRPSFTLAAPPEKAESLYNSFIGKFKEYGVSVQEGLFGERMQVRLTNNGPVTIIINSKDK